MKCRTLARDGRFSILGNLGNRIEHRRANDGIDGPVHRPPDAQRINRLDQPRLGAAAPCEMHVSRTVEQHDDRHVAHRTSSLVKPECHRDRHATHRPDLEVQHGDIGHLHVHCW